ncbi:anhydro-N-acetylmuramic acid kinase [Rhodobacteraceae bacterium RKSG542]|uniref:anhydro-N-acetylmuramic acid kinase n=1 Tax=Pseudovibrio flavus TaxID=2529854 RepID=UPI0012BD2670|nr:anhydro-N-acetylmuramic acid kinase [Pseudovibrio flavus]MTI19382.1 anhydro-N-acetylmuramic acid kinase [Pseudovibrio flavus]
MEMGWSVGLMTGTVLDGNIDIALIKSDGETVDALGPSTLAPYTSQTLALLQETLEVARKWDFNGPEPEIFKEAERALTTEQAEAVGTFLAENGIAPSEVSVIGFHGQTVLHRAPTPTLKGATRQLGDGQLMADHLGIKVAYDFRSMDVEAGGQGAPLAAIYHQALLSSLGSDQHPSSSVILNLGGVGNLSWWDGNDMLIAFDTGPANAPINDWVKRHGAGEMDRDGRIASTGTVDEAKLAALLEHPYFAQKTPKSLDRFSFDWTMALGETLEDGAALLTAFSASAVAKALTHLPVKPQNIYVCGGGRRNPQLLAEIASRTGATAHNADSLGWRGDSIEAECFAFLAQRTLKGLPISFPGTTGVPTAMTGGRIAAPTVKN